MGGVRICERMAGWITWTQPDLFPEFTEGTHYPFEINISAYCNSLRYPFLFQFKGECSFVGRFKKEIPIQGTMRISHRGVAYDFKMNLLDKEKNPVTVRIQGEKKYHLFSLSWKVIRRSLIWLPFVATQQEKLIGQGEMSYLEPLFYFPRCVSVTRAKYAWDPEKKLIDSIINLIPFYIPNWKKVSDEEAVRKNIGTHVVEASLFYKKALKFSVLLTKALSLFHLDIKNRIINLLLLPLSTAVYRSVYSTDKYLISVGQNIPQLPKNLEEEKWMELNTTPTAAPANFESGTRNAQSATSQGNEIEVDVVVVGSGAGGAALAYQLSSTGLAVAVVEEGDYFKRQDMVGKSVEMVDKLYRKRGQNFALSNAPLWLPTGKCVGGTTVINSGTAMRTPDHILDLWEKHLKINANDFKKYFQPVEEMLCSKKTPTQLLGGIYEVLQKGLGPDALKCQPLDRAENGCDGQAGCIFGCPIAAKRSTDVSFLKSAMQNNVYLFSNYHVEKILTENKKAVGIRARLENYGDEFQLTIRAKKVVLAAGTYNTPWLLYRSGLDFVSEQIGKNLSIHPALAVGGLFENTVREQFYVPQSLKIMTHENAHNSYMLEGYTIPIDGIPIAFPLHGDEVVSVMSRVKNFTNFAAMITDPTLGKLIMTKKGPLPWYFINKELLKIINKAIYEMGHIFFKAGAKEVLTPVYPIRMIKNQNELEMLFERKIPAYNYTLSAYHPLGTCRMGNSNLDSVTNSEGKVWNIDNLFVADGSAIPGPLGVNPQITIMANALRIGDIIKSELS